MFHVARSGRAIRLSVHLLIDVAAVSNLKFLQPPPQLSWRHKVNILPSRRHTPARGASSQPASKLSVRPLTLVPTSASQPEVCHECFCRAVHYSRVWQSFVAGHICSSPSHCSSGPDAIILTAPRLSQDPSPPVAHGICFFII